MMPFTIVTPNGVLYQDDVEKVTIPTQAGEITILEAHAPMVSIIQAGEMHIHKDGNVVPLAVSTGFMEMRPTGELFIIADTAERAEDIDLSRAEAAKARAEELLKQQDNMADVDFARIQASIEKELARISVGKKYRR
ncbi:ATP synthase F1 subunit epsilon [Patescibacteria group bacterium]|nr:ATP synthase F1 subunit epsilon [Patescibacteria group bacterium]MBU1722001.1 ATP synthase F1 subunit epsilon [Patescibacteria group bacterium]MBU1901249.1 ATP synthase F1 subunit epsilon [Patescibacteria group bacterium]